MHALIYALVQGKTEEEALNKARDIFTRTVYICGLDYLSMFDQNDWYKNAYDDLPPIARIDSDDGKMFIEKSMNEIEKHFFEKVKLLRGIIAESTDQELFENKMNFLEVCENIGAIIGPKSWEPLLCMEDIGDEGVIHCFRTCQEMKKALEQYTPEETWVVPADVHY